MALPKPIKKPEWATGAADIVEPGAAKKAIGWLVEKPPHQFWNWFWNLCYQWIAYFESKTDELTDELATEIADRDAAVTSEANTRGLADTLLGEKILRAYDFIVGTEPGCTHATLEAALAVAYGAQKILVTSDVFSDDTYQVIVPDLEIEFKPGMYCNHSMPTGDTMYINAPNVTIRGGKFSQGAGASISIGPNAHGAMLRDIRFEESGISGLEVNDPNDLATIVGCITSTVSI
jgi:hypothetical protein